MYSAKTIFSECINKIAKDCGCDADYITFMIHGTKNAGINYYFTANGEFLKSKNGDTNFELKQILGVIKYMTATQFGIEQKINEVLISLSEKYKTNYENTSACFNHKMLDIKQYKDEEVEGVFALCEGNRTIAVLSQENIFEIVKSEQLEEK